MGKPYSPEKLRAILANPSGTTSANPAIDAIGIMPNMKQIIIDIIGL
jgi:hypothetical protein